MHGLESENVPGTRAMFEKADHLSFSTKPVLRINDNPAAIMKTSIPVLSQY